MAKNYDATINASSYFELDLKQSDLDFVDVKLNDDNKLFIDPRLIENSMFLWSNPIKKTLNSYFGNLLVAITSGNTRRTKLLLAGLEEPKETRLGYGKLNTNGNAVGEKLKEELVKNIINNPAIQSKTATKLSDLMFFIPLLNSDRISDITTKIIKTHLVEYTQKQCRLHGIPMSFVRQNDLLNTITLEWENKKVELPIFIENGIKKAIILVPKSFVNTSSYASSNIYSFFRFARNFVKSIDDQDFLKGIPRNGKDNTILVKDIDKNFPDKKNELSKWVVKHPNILKNFWIKTYDNVKPLSDNVIEAIIYDYTRSAIA